MDLEIRQATQDIQVMGRQNDGILDQIQDRDEQIREMTRLQLDLYRELKILEAQREVKAAERLNMLDDFGEVTKKFNDIKNATNSDHR